MSPQKASRLAERAAKEAGERHREKRKSMLMIIGVALASVILLIGDYLWLKALAQKRREEHLQRQHQRAQTNPPAAFIPGARPTNLTETP